MNGLEDQLAAATREARERFEGLAGGQGRIVTVRRSHVLGWQSVEPGDLEACAHIVAGGPRPIFGLVGMPGSLFCSHCIAIAEAAYVLEHPSTCDLCFAETKEFREIALNDGVLLTVTGWLCVPCFRRSVDPGAGS